MKALRGSRWVVLITGLTMAGAVLALAGPAGAAERKKFTIGMAVTPPNHVHISPYVAKELGYFAEEGLDVDVQPISSGGQANQLLAAGQAQVGFNAAVGTLTGRAQSVNLKAVYNYLRKHATGIVVLEASPIKTPQDLKGKTIGTASVGSARALDARAMVKAAGLNPDTDVTFQVAGIGAQGLTALQQGRVDALSLWDATYVDMENLGAKLRRFNFPFQEGIFSYVLQGMEDYIDKNPDVIVGVGRALAKATVFAETNPEAATRIHLKLYPVQTAADPNKIFQDSLAVVKDNLKNGALEPGLTNYGSFSRQSWEKVVDYYIELGLLKEKPPIERLYVSDDLNRQMNQFDRAAIQRQAREWKG